jgi:hypothetical protein
VTLTEAGPLPPLTEREHWAVRVAFGIVLAALLVGFWTFAQQFRAAAHGGADQNGYLVGGRLLAAHFSSGFKPDDPYAFVGRMWIAAPDGRYFPKYPAGLPVIVAIVYRLAGPSAAYFISPVAMTLALAAVFLIVRLVAGSFGGVLAVVIVATSPVTLGLTNNPNSHAAALCCVSWGFYLLLRWWQRRGSWRAALAGLLLGCAATIRYGEALVLLPVLLVALFNVRLRERGSWLEAAALLGGWVLPIMLLLVSNRLTLGAWTGYDATGESTGFDRQYLAQNWDGVIRQLAGAGLFLTLPLGVLGLVQLFARNWRVATVLWAWVLPGVLLYGAYYWAPARTTSGRRCRCWGATTGRRRSSRTRRRGSSTTRRRPPGRRSSARGRCCITCSSSGTTACTRGRNSTGRTSPNSRRSRIGLGRCNPVGRARSVYCCRTRATPNSRACCGDWRTAS